MDNLHALPLGANDYITGTYPKVISNLNSASVQKFYNAYLDIPWDDPNYRIFRGDQRWQLPDVDPLGATTWYRQQTAEIRANLALDRTVLRVKLGIVFENILIRGMMAFAATLPNNVEEFRYALHECIEETQHSLMFQEFVNRSGSNPSGLTFPINILARYIIHCGGSFPELFFIFVLGGEEPIDFEQRKQLKEQPDLHPLMKVMNKIHITEEARHICFARAYLKQSVARLSAWKKLKLKLLVPMILGSMGKLFLEPPNSLIKQYGIPPDIVATAYRHPERKKELQAAMGAIIHLCEELGLLNKITRPLWRYFSLVA